MYIDEWKAEKVYRIFEIPEEGSYLFVVPFGMKYDVFSSFDPV